MSEILNLKETSGTYSSSIRKQEAYAKQFFGKEWIDVAQALEYSKTYSDKYPATPVRDLDNKFPCNFVVEIECGWLRTYVGKIDEILWVAEPPKMHINVNVLGSFQWDQPKRFRLVSYDICEEPDVSE